MRHSSLQIALVAAAAATTISLRPTVSSAQERRLTDVPDSVPRALVEAVIDPTGTMRMMGGGARPRLLVGTLPSGLVRRLWIPPGATILGGVESSAYGMAVIHSTMSEDSLNAGYSREQPRLGWTLPRERPPMAMMGFVSASIVGAVADAPSGMFCSGGTTLTVSVSPLDPLTREIRVTAMNLSDPRCQTSAAVVTRVVPMGINRPQYPTLVNPPGSGNGYAGPACTFWNSTGGGGSTRLQTSMSADDLFLHYGKQLVDSGWTPGTNQTVSRSWTRRDSTGTLTELTLTARLQPASPGSSPGFSPGCVDIQMEVRSRRPS